MSIIPDTNDVLVTLPIQHGDCAGLQYITYPSIYGVFEDLSHNQPSLVTININGLHSEAACSEARNIYEGSRFPRLA